MTAAGATGSPVDVTVTQAGTSITTLPGDIDGNNKVDAVDVQLVINGALGLPGPHNTDVNNDNNTDAIDVQMVINAALGL